MTGTLMQEPTYLLLAALADAPRHGYALMTEVTAMSAGRVTLRAGTLYAALDRLTGAGLVEPVGTEVVAGRHRRYYALTDHGATALAAETERLSANAAQARRRLAIRAATVTP